jgi:hypothetical protein
LSGPQTGVRKRQSERAERPHSKFSDREALDGPAMRPATPLAVENGVGKLAANARQMPAWERERLFREVNEVSAGPVKQLPKAGDVTNNTAGL